MVAPALMAPPGMAPPPMPGPPGLAPPMAPPQTAPPPPPTSPHLADPLGMAFDLAGMTDEALRGYLKSIDQEESFALLQLLASTPAAAGLIERIQGLVRKPSTREPKPPRGWTRPPKPTWGEVRAFADRQEARYQTFRAQVAFDLEVYAGERTGAFAADLERYKRGEFEPFWSTALKNEADLARATAATAPVTVKHQAKSAATKRESQECEDALREWRRKNALRWSESGHAALPWCEATSLILTGVVVGRVAIDPEDSACPIRYDLVDPTTCYPEFGGRQGLRRVVRKYCDTVANVAGDYGVDPADLMRSRVRDAATGRDRPIREDDTVEVVEYWDSLRRGVCLADGTVVLPMVEHKYYVVPFVWQAGGLGLPDFLGRDRTEERTVYDADGTRRTVLVAGRQDDPARALVSHIHGSVRRHLQDEAVHAKAYNMAAGAGREAVLLYQDEMARATNKKPELNRGAGKVNRFMKDHEEVAPVGEAPNPAVFGPILAKLARDETTDLMPPEARGLSQNSQATGSAIETKIEAGAGKLAWIFDALELFHARIFRLQLTLFERWGHILGEAGERGRLTVPYARSRRLPPGSEPYFAITPETVRTAGTHVEVDLTDVAKKNLAALAAAGATMTTNEFASRWWVQDKLFNFDDPDEMQAEINLDKLLADPAMRKIGLLRDIRRVYTDTATGVLDPEGEWLMRLVERELGGAGGAGGAGPPGAAPPGMGGPPAMPMTSGTDLTAFNPNVGAGAGRPAAPTPLPLPGPAGPTPIY